MATKKPKPKKPKSEDPKIVELDRKKLDEVLQRVNEEDRELLRMIIESYIFLLEELRDKQTSIARLRKMIFGSSSEKTDAVLGEETNSDSPPADDQNPTDDNDNNDDSKKDSKKKPRKGHGRNGADAFYGAKNVLVSHESLQPGDSCPECGQSSVYDTKRPQVLIRLVGQAPIGCTVFRLQKLRCNLCGKLFTASPPKEAGPEKYDPTVASMIALLKYGSGLPFNRLQGLQGSLGIPLPVATQWDIVHNTGNFIQPIYDELSRQAAQGDVLYNDDTTIKILEMMGKRAKAKVFTEKPDSNIDPKRTGMFTSGIVSTKDGRRIALFFTGRQHAGENLVDVLAQRLAELNPPIQMCDALSRNMPAELNTIVANCIAHGRRKFADVVDRFRDECRYVLKALEVIYKNDAVARKQKMSPDERLQYHQSLSGPVMQELHAWLKKQLDDRLVETNSGLGESITYMLNHWQKMTLFLRKADAPLDNNICERALKKAILHRKNSMFFKTQNGARVADIFMSIIYTCELCQVDPFDYLTELQRHVEALSANSENWMPWNYRQTLEQMNPAEKAPGPAVAFDASISPAVSATR